jgi:hypothetical protein
MVDDLEQILGKLVRNQALNESSGLRHESPHPGN